VTEQHRPDGAVEADEPAATAPEGTPEPAADNERAGSLDASRPRPAPLAPEEEEEVVVGEVVDATDVDVESGSAAASGLGAELEALRSEVEERTQDLQRVTAEYANYRKRVERDRALVGEQATGNVLLALLPVLDDIDRAREHDDLVGPLASMAEQLANATAKFGLTAFGAKGDPFDPTRHEAVAHLTSADVKEPTCIDVMRRGYLLGERLLRPALVAVADPEQQQ
jgi:molecular chaperone GrpE